MMSIIEKVCLGLLLAILCFGGFKLLEYGFDGEMLYECHQMQQWSEQGYDVKPPEYCYEDLGMERR